MLEHARRNPHLYIYQKQNRQQQLVPTVRRYRTFLVVRNTSLADNSKITVGLLGIKSSAGRILVQVGFFNIYVGGAPWDKSVYQVCCLMLLDSMPKPFLERWEPHDAGKSPRTQQRGGNLQHAFFSPPRYKAIPADTCWSDPLITKSWIPSIFCSPDPSERKPTVGILKVSVLFSQAVIYLTAIPGDNFETLFRPRQHKISRAPSRHWTASAKMYMVRT